MDELVNKTLGQFQITRELGRGGMAIVYEAFQPALQRKVAIKVLLPSLGSDIAFVQRFQHEAIAAASLRHPNIVTIHDVGSQDQYSFIVMEYLEGRPLSDVIRTGGPMPLARICTIIEQVAQALDYAHEHGFVHRDIKPGNVMLREDDHATLTDFGIARALMGTHLTQTGTMIGTPEYMSPEQVTGEEIDRRTDVYALGIVAYEMVTREVPFSGTTVSVLYKQAHEPPPPLRGRVPGVSAAAESVILRALAKRRDERYPTAGQFAQTLTAAACGQSVAMPPHPMAPTVGMPQPVHTPPPQPVYTPPPYAPSTPWPQTPTTTRSPGRAAWLGWAVAGLAVLGLCVIIALVGIVPLSRLLKAQVTPATPITSTRMANVTLTLIPTPAQPSRTPTAPTVPAPPTTAPRPTLTPSRNIGLRWFSIGQSVQGRDLAMASIGDGSNTTVVVVGSIQGDQPNTRDLVNALVSYFERNPQQVPKGMAFYFMPSLNPDGNASNSRYNANGVDLNRNWDTTDWRSDAAVPENPEGKLGAGGSRPLSEPETRALSDFLFGLQPGSSNLRIAVIHSSVRRSQGEVYPGGDTSVDISRAYASAAGYDVQSGWAEYTTSGELVTWCTQKGFLSLDIVVPGSQKPSTQVPGTNQTLLDITVRALLKVADYR